VLLAQGAELIQRFEECDPANLRMALAGYPRAANHKRR
jgi:hypothetical protein